MYRRTEASIPADFKFATDLKGMGYFLNDQDQIRMVEPPNQGFHYKASKNERFVQTQKEAMSGERYEIFIVSQLTTARMHSQNHL